MFLEYWGKKRLIFKIFVCAMVLFLVPIGVISNLTFRHLRTIKDVSLQEVRNALLTAQIDFLKNHLAQKAGKISTEFSDIRDEVHLLSALSQAILENPDNFRYRNGSHYRLDEVGDYSNPVDDGNSSLYVPRRLPSLDSLIPAMENFGSAKSPRNIPEYNTSLDSLISATESLDIILKPLVKSEPRVVLGWFIHKDLISRTYPWRDFKHLPRYPKVTSWPFYYLSDPAHNPSRQEVFTPVYTDPLTQDNMISCLSPVFVGGEQRATVGVDITVETLLKEIRQVRLTDGSSTLLMSHGEIIAASENLPLAVLGLNPTLPSAGQSLTPEFLSATGRAVVGPKRDKFGVDFVNTPELRAYVGYAQVESLGWQLFLLVPEEDLLGPVNKKAQAIFSETERIRGNFVHFLVFAVLAMASIGYVVVAHQSRGLRTLLAGIREFGRGNLTHRVRDEGTEFGDLSQALNSMAESLLVQNQKLEKANAEVEQGRKLTAVGRLAAGVAHEVNNPLATISTYTQLLLRRSDLSGEASDNLQKVMGEIDRIQLILRNFLNLSRLQKLVKTRVNPDVLVRDVVEMARHEAGAMGVELHLFLSETPADCCLDQSGFKQILWNLLGNAIASQTEAGQVLIRTSYILSESESSVFILEVEDEGPGISEEVMPHIFDPFFTTKEVGKGTGLGLAVVSSIVDGHHGRIEVQNLSPKGCRFRVIFPAGESE
ncbi:HAMP domain-containing histidine kinase [Geopsychrobacter electrodiphilus]|uniref:HAMP domain-containing histidine kinase n=1 Tax=Geopsychrobacter electrodiphilus TaxID=225196 RepID=UPI0003669486|nr:HAMP domain-containing histidine kinase [Geopsychrobacter electrodiphilus]